MSALEAVLRATAAARSCAIDPLDGADARQQRGVGAMHKEGQLHTDVPNSGEAAPSG